MLKGFFGLLIGAVGLGTMLSGFYMLLRQKQVDPWLDMQAGLFLIIFLPGLLALVSLVDTALFKNVLALSGSLLGGAGVGFLMIQSATILQTESPADVLGSVSGYYQATMVAGQLVAIIGVPLLVPTWLGIVPFLGLIMLGLTGVLIYTTLSLAGLRRQSLAEVITP